MEDFIPNHITQRFIFPSVLHQCGRKKLSVILTEAPSLRIKPQAPKCYIKFLFGWRTLKSRKQSGSGVKELLNHWEKTPKQIVLL